MPRFAFRSASDEALYQRVNNWRATAESPYFLVLETVSSHQPYKDPESGAYSIKRVIKYADRAFGDFLEELDQSGFFSDGVLMVLSDHRSMTPIPARELEIFGDNAHSIIPAFIIGNGFDPGATDDRVHSQADLVPTFEFWQSGQSHLATHQSLMFGDSEVQELAALGSVMNCAFHSRGNQGALVEVVCSAGSGQIRLDGDQTRFTHSEGLDEETREEVLTNIAVIRLQGLERHKARQTILEGIH